jgi:uncharacterized protein YehS (DUF1456 family)
MIALLAFLCVAVCLIWLEVQANRELIHNWVRLPNSEGFKHCRKDVAIKKDRNNLYMSWAIYVKDEKLDFHYRTTSRAVRAARKIF